MRKLLPVFSSLGLALALVACAGSNEVGDQSLLEFDQQQADALGLGGTTVPTTVPVAVETTAPPVVTAAPVTEAVTTLPPEQQQVTIEVSINDASPYFDPTVVNVLVGSRVRFVNHGATPHRVLSDTAAFDSGEIPPGGVWIYDATTPGQFNYSDGGRPFAVGTLIVQ